MREIRKSWSKYFILPIRIVGNFIQSPKFKRLYCFDLPIHFMISIQKYPTDGEVNPLLFFVNGKDKSVCDLYISFQTSYIKPKKSKKKDQTSLYSNIRYLTPLYLIIFKTLKRSQTPTSYGINGISNYSYSSMRLQVGGFLQEPRRFFVFHTYYYSQRLLLFCDYYRTELIHVLLLFGTQEI